MTTWANTSATLTRPTSCVQCVKMKSAIHTTSLIYVTSRRSVHCCLCSPQTVTINQFYFKIQLYLQCSTATTGTPDRYLIICVYLNWDDYVINHLTNLITKFHPRRRCRWTTERRCFFACSCQYGLRTSWSPGSGNKLCWVTFGESWTSISPMLVIFMTKST